MGSPAQLRAEAQELRDVASALREKASDLLTDMDGLRDNYVSSRDDIWEGPAADDLFGQLGEVRSDLVNLRTDVRGYATNCVTRARQLESDADTLEAEQAAEDE